MLGALVNLPIQTLRPATMDGLNAIGHLQHEQNEGAQSCGKCVRHLKRHLCMDDSSDGLPLLQ